MSAACGPSHSCSRFAGLPCLQCQPHLQHRQQVHARQARHSHQAGARRSCRSSTFITSAAADQPIDPGTTQQAQSKAPVLIGATAAEQQVNVGTLQQAQSDAPVLIGAGGGIFFFWQIGGTQYLNAHYGELPEASQCPDMANLSSHHILCRSEQGGDDRSVCRSARGGAGNVRGGLLAT